MEPASAVFIREEFLCLVLNLSVALTTTFSRIGTGPMRHPGLSHVIIEVDVDELEIKEGVSPADPEIPFGVQQPASWILHPESVSLFRIKKAFHFHEHLLEQIGGCHIQSPLVQLRQGRIRERIVRYALHLAGFAFLDLCRNTHDD